MKNLEQKSGNVTAITRNLGHNERELLDYYMDVDPASVYDCKTCNNCGSGDCGDCCEVGED